jgi:hypothetical protein
VLQDFVGPVADDSGVCGQLVLVGDAQPQRGSGGAKRLFDAFCSAELVVGPVQVQFLAPCGVPGPAQKHGAGDAIVGRRRQTDRGAVLAGAGRHGRRRQVGLALRQHAGNPVEHGAHQVRGIGQSEGGP